MILLQSIFKKNSYSYKLIQRNEHFSITEQFSNTFPDHLIAYEVFRIHITKPNSINGLSEPKETTPSNEQWGIYAKTTTSLHKALDYFNTWTQELITKNLITNEQHNQ